MGKKEELRKHARLQTSPSKPVKMNSASGVGEKRRTKLGGSTSDDLLGLQKITKEMEERLPEKKTIICQEG